MSNRTDRIQTQPFDGNRKGTQGCLAAYRDRARPRKRLTQCNVELAVVVLVDNLPRDDVLSLDVQDLSRSGQRHADRTEFALQDLVLNLVILTQQSDPESGFDGARGGEEEFTFARLACRFPSQLGVSGRRKKADPCVVLVRRNNRLRITSETERRIKAA